jgi:hypothetical protein
VNERKILRAKHYLIKEFHLEKQILRTKGTGHCRAQKSGPKAALLDTSRQTAAGGPLFACQDFQN